MTSAVGFDRQEIRDTYYQFPLTMVTKAPDKELHRRMRDDAANYAIAAYSKNLTGNAQVGAREFQLVSNPGHDQHRWLQEINGMDHATQQFLAGAYGLWVTRAEQNAHNAKRWALAGQELYNKHRGKGWQVRLRQDLFWDAINHEWPPHKIRILCSIYAIIGRDGYKRISHGLIRALASGYVGQKQALEAEASRAEAVANGTQSNRGPKAEQIPESTVRYWIDHLHSRGLFRLCLHKSHRYYAIADFNSDEDFAKFILRKEPKREKRAVISTRDL